MILVLVSISTALNNFRKKKIIILIRLEIIIIVLIIMVLTFSIDSSSRIRRFVTILMVIVTERVLGLSIITASSRNRSWPALVSKS